MLIYDKCLSFADIKSYFVVVKAKPECCSEQNRNREKRLADRGSVHDFALKKTIIENPWGRILGGRP